MQKIKNIAPYLIFAFFSTVVLAKPFGSGDELWNYSFAKNIADNMVPYRDFSIVQTPLSAYVPALFMALFGDGLFVHRVVGVFLLFAIIALCYHLCKKLTGSGFVGFICAMLSACVCLPFYIYNYNYFSVLLILLIFEIETNEKQSPICRSVAVGLAVGALLLVKQSTGAFLFAANLIICALNVLKFKEGLKPQLLRAAASLVPVCIFLIYMLSVGAFGDFLDYAVFGISTFVHRTGVLDMLAEVPFFCIYIALIAVAFFKMLKKAVKKEAERHSVALMLFAAAWLFVTYPLFDAFHLVCIFFVLAPALCSFVKVQDYKPWEKSVCIIVVAFVSLVSAASFFEEAKGMVPSVLNNYERIPTEAEADERIGIVCEYIKRKKDEGYRVRIADDSAVAFKLPLDYYEKNWDMLLVGNLGMASVEDLLASEEDCLYMVRGTGELGSQSHFELIEYVKTNYEKVEEVLNFDVYRKP
ncbi:MAG: hypothetical protein E7619_04890 [Ruminococcaceae bacterium]|nr:hypothetical protein [Oscillospiraceae bacterium]